jgi:hypothetical protein
VTLTCYATIWCLSRRKCFRWQSTYAQKVSHNGASTILEHASSLIKAPCANSHRQFNHWQPFWVKIQSTASYLCLKNDCQCSVNNFRPCISENEWVVRPHCSVILLSAACHGNSACQNIVTMSKNERQRNINGTSPQCQQFLILHLA